MKILMVQTAEHGKLYKRVMDNMEAVKFLVELTRSGIKCKYWEVK